MAIVSDDYHAVNAATVSSVTKPSNESVWYLSVYSPNCPPVTLWFADLGARDDFYKKLVEAMGS